MQDALWHQCLEQLRTELPSHQFNTWLKPLGIVSHPDEVVLSAPNRFIANWVRDKYLSRISAIAESYGFNGNVSIEVKSKSTTRSFVSSGATAPVTVNVEQSPGIDRSSRVADKPAITEEPVAESAVISNTDVVEVKTTGAKRGRTKVQSYLNKSFTFKSFVEGKSNQLALAASQQVAENAGGAYNPLFIYGGVGLGKTHLMQAIGNEIIEQNPAAKVVYLHSERFVADMVKALQLNAMAEFKRFYRSLDALLIDDIQFFAKKDRS
ncbi:MAG: DnaA/Hda family protein, partial [Reinekea sp.]|nr:DnaA/Hda family protein [Reinekea sp.]